MEGFRPQEDPIESSGPVSREHGSWRLPMPFEHRDVFEQTDPSLKIPRTRLVNVLNYYHFMDRAVLVHLHSLKYEESIILRAHPKPCPGEVLTCTWSDDSLEGCDLDRYEFRHLLVDDGQSILVVPCSLRERTKAEFTLLLPESCFTVGRRGCRRYLCDQQVAAEISQDGFTARGELVDFSPSGFCVRVSPEVHSSFHGYNSGELTGLSLRKNGQILFSQACRCIRQGEGVQVRKIALAPTKARVSRFSKREYRNRRQCLVPAPVIVFDHPFFGKRVQLEVEDISTSGFSVYEDKNVGVLVPGMIIPHLSIFFSGVLRIECLAQVIYRQDKSENGKGIRCGLAILDMDMGSYSHLTAILVNAMDPYSRVSCQVDMDELWEFFFDTGFVYPKKYGLISSYRRDLKETYRRLYQETPEIARHFTYQKNGRIYSHLFMLLAYENAWLIQHHASKPMEGKWTAFSVLRQIIHFLNDVRRLPSIRLGYLMSYYRPENKFPERVFGGFARSLSNPRGCSVDSFAYLSVATHSIGQRLPEGWSIRECSKADWWDLAQFYNHKSGGLLLDVISPNRGNTTGESIQEVYAGHGFSRKWEAYSLLRRDELMAVLIVNHSDLGLNLSELLNSIKVFVIDAEGPPYEVLALVIARFAAEYKLMQKIPVLIYPKTYLETKGVSCEKEYCLWILDTRYGSDFVKHMQKKFRASYV